MGVEITIIGGPTAIVRLGGLTLITDPTFDPPQSYAPRPGVELTKTVGPAIPMNRLGLLDAVLLSHDQHVDNLDTSGRELLATVPRIYTTPSAASRLGDLASPLANWETASLPVSSGAVLDVTAVPARHGPEGSEHLVGEVTGFVLLGAGIPSVYISGDNQSLAVVHEIRERLGPVDVAVLFAGGAQLPYLQSAYLTLTGVMAVEATRILGARRVVPVHLTGWAHLTEGPPAIRAAFSEAGLADRLALLEPGDSSAI